MANTPGSRDALANAAASEKAAQKEHERQADAAAKAADDHAALVKAESESQVKAAQADQTEHEKEDAASARAAAEQAAKDRAAAGSAAAKVKAAHIVAITGGKPCKGMANSTGNDGVAIPRDGVLTIALITTTSPRATHHPGEDVSCVARLPDKAEIGDVVEVYCVPGVNGGSAFVHPPKRESIGVLPVSTGDNVGTGVEVPPDTGRHFRKISAAAWQVLGG